jgi:hypothetical protein
MFSTRSTSPPKSLWPGGVDHVDLHALVAHAHVLAQDGDAALTLQVVVVQQQVGLVLVVAEELALVQDLVHQRGLAVVHVGDDGDVAEWLHGRAEGGGKKAGKGKAFRPGWTTGAKAAWKGHAQAP